MTTTTANHPGRDITVAWIHLEATREQLIAWLQWNDSKGCYSDDECAAEGFAPLSLAHAQQIAYHQAFEQE